MRGRGAFTTDLPITLCLIRGSKLKWKMWTKWKMGLCLNSLKIWQPATVRLGERSRRSLYRWSTASKNESSFHQNEERGRNLVPKISRTWQIQIRARVRWVRSRSRLNNLGSSVCRSLLLRKGFIRWRNLVRSLWSTIQQLNLSILQITLRRIERLCQALRRSKERPCLEMWGHLAESWIKISIRDRNLSQILLEMPRHLQELLRSTFSTLSILRWNTKQSQ